MDFSRLTGSKSKAEESSEEISLLRKSQASPGRRSLDSVEEDEQRIYDHHQQSDSLPATTSTHRRHRLRFNRPLSRKSSTALVVISLITLLSIIIIISTYLGLIRLSDDIDPSHPIKWHRPPPPTIREWSNYYGLVRPKLGSQDWKSLYPPSKPAGPKPLPNWVARYDYLRSISSSNRPDSPLSTTWTNPQAKLSMKNGLAEYPDGTIFNHDPNGICSYRRASCLRGEKEDHGYGFQDIWFGKPRTWSINFDDGPLPPSASLYRFLDDHRATATHFWVGSNDAKTIDQAIAYLLMLAALFVTYLAH